MADRNPYVMLGIPFGSSLDVATRAFDRRAKGRRQQPGSASELTELTWALDQVAEVLRNPRAALDIYRVPADPGALEPAGGVGVLRPGPEALGRSTGPSDQAWERLLDAAREEALAALYRQIAASAALPPR